MAIEIQIQTSGKTATRGKRQAERKDERGRDGEREGARQPRHTSRVVLGKVGEVVRDAVDHHRGLRKGGGGGGGGKEQDEQSSGNDPPFPEAPRGGEVVEIGQGSWGGRRMHTTRRVVREWRRRGRAKTREGRGEGLCVNVQGSACSQGRESGRVGTGARGDDMHQPCRPWPSP